MGRRACGVFPAGPDRVRSMKKAAAYTSALILIFLFSTVALAGAGGSNAENGDDRALSLTPAEKEWLKTHPVIRVGGPKSFPPFHYYDENGRPLGIGPEFAANIMNRLGLKLEYQSPLPWPQVLENIQEGRLDVIACIARSPEREEYLEFSAPYLSFPLVIISRRDESFIGGLEDLHGRRTALVKKISTYDWLRRDQIGVIPVPVDSPLEALQAVSQGRADAAIENLAAAFFLIQRNGLFDLKVAAPTSWGNYKLFFAVRQDWPVLVDLINKALGDMPPELQSGIRNKWISVRYEFGVSPGKIARWAAVVLIPLILLLSFGFFYNRRLRREMNEKEKAQRDREKVIRDLQTALANIKELKGLLPICASCKKIRDDRGYWQQVEVYLLEHSGAEFSHSICPDCMREIYPDIAEKVLARAEEDSGG